MVGIIFLATVSHFFCHFKNDQFSDRLSRASPDWLSAQEYNGLNDLLFDS